MRLEEKQRIIYGKITDCRRIGFLCLFLGGFLFIGTLIPAYEGVPHKSEILLLSSQFFLLLALFFRWRMAQLKRKLDQ
ncbi:hypothetical protein EWH99_06735 [Sporolactobacillus sp. THM7-7]|nr:hypothetical protein EWH99_06735 [Sporolactobacillus sp. THM7-7]